MRTPIAFVLVTVLALPACTQQPAPPPAQQSVSGQVIVGTMTLPLPPGEWVLVAAGEMELPASQTGTALPVEQKVFLQVEKNRVAAALIIDIGKRSLWAPGFGGSELPQGLVFGDCGNWPGRYYNGSLRNEPGRTDCLVVGLMRAFPDGVQSPNRMTRRLYGKAAEYGGLPQNIVLVAYDVYTRSAIGAVDLLLNPELAGLADWPLTTEASRLKDIPLDAAHKTYLDDVVQRAEAWRPEVAAALP